MRFWGRSLAAAEELVVAKMEVMKDFEVIDNKRVSVLVLTQVTKFRTFGPPKVRSSSDFEVSPTEPAAPCV